MTVVLETVRDTGISKDQTNRYFTSSLRKERFLIIITTVDLKVVFMTFGLLLLCCKIKNKDK